MNHRLTIRRHGRAIAMVGALVAVGATTTMALVAGTASAAPPATQPGTCIDNVNVRADASVTSKIVTVCERGTAVTVAETRNGFVHLTDLNGWAAQEFVSVTGETPAMPPVGAATTTPAPAARTPDTSGSQVGTAGDSYPAVNAPATTDPAAADRSGGAPSAGPLGSGVQGGGLQGGGSPSPVGGLLG